MKHIARSILSFLDERPFSKERSRLLKIIENSCASVMPSQLIDIEYNLARQYLSPYKTVMYKTDKETRLVEKDIIKIFDDSAQCLLMLGEPGAGKTTSLYNLALLLCTRCRIESDLPIPLIVYLSNWGQLEKNSTIIDWLTKQINQLYDIPIKDGRKWIEENKFCFLLDGFDEIKEEQREYCTISINHFLRNNTTRHIAISSRISEYDLLKIKLGVDTVIKINPLEKYQITSYFEKKGLNHLTSQYLETELLQNIINTPLMVDVLESSLKTIDKDMLEQSIEKDQLKEYLWECFLNHALEEKKNEEDKKISLSIEPKDEFHPTSLPKEVINWWVSVLAFITSTTNESMFFVEQLQPYILDNKYRSWFIILQSFFMSVFAGLILGIGMGLVFGQSMGVVFGLIAGLNILMTPLLLIALNRIRSNPIRYFLSYGLGAGIPLVTISNFFMDFSSVLKSSLSGALVWGFVGILFSLNNNDYYMDLIIPRGQSFDWTFSWKKLIKSLMFGTIAFIFLGLPTTVCVAISSDLSLGLFWGKLIGSSFALAISLSIYFRTIIDKEENLTNPNENIHRSGRNAIRSIIPGLLLILFSIVFKKHLQQTIFDVNDFYLYDYLKFLGVFNILILSVFSGLKVYFSHYILRFLLFVSGYGPLRYVGFLEYVCRLRLLKRIGVGYVFFHRELRDHMVKKLKGE